MDSDEESWEDFLERNLHELKQRILPSRFYGWLRSKRVFTKEDQEQVENTGVTSAEKSMNLIDLVKTKGEAGYEAFMEVLQYEYPHIYRSLTGNEPAKPPRSFIAQSNPVSDLMPMVLELLNGISSNITSDGKPIKEMMRDLEVENECMKKKLATFEDLEKEISTLNEQLAKNQGFALKYVEERDTAMKQNSDLLKERDEVVQKCNQLMVELDELRIEMEEVKGKRRLERSATIKLHSQVESRPSIEEMNQVKQENDDLKAKINGLWVTAAIKTCSEAKKKAKEREKVLEFKVLELVQANENLVKKLQTSQDRLTTVQKENDQMAIENEDLANQVKTFKLKADVGTKQKVVQTLQTAKIYNERDKFLEYSNTMERRCQDLEKENESLHVARDKLWLSLDKQQDRLKELQVEVRLLRGPLRFPDPVTRKSLAVKSVQMAVEHNVTIQPINREKSKPIDSCVMRPNITHRM